MNDTEWLPERSEFVSALLAALTTPAGTATAEAALRSREDQRYSTNGRPQPCPCITHPAAPGIAADKGA